MIALIQRVSRASVSIGGAPIASINHGFLILLGIFTEDTVSDIEYLSTKIIALRIMDDDQGKMNRSITETGGEILVVSQFTLCADVSKGRRPSYIKAMEPVPAKKMYEAFVESLRQKETIVQTGRFGAYMDVSLHNDGPVTIILDSKYR